MIPLTVAQLARATGGQIIGPEGSEHVVIDGPVVTDSRAVARGGLYVARVGEQADGHAFVGAARRAGRSRPSPPTPSLSPRRCRASSSTTSRPPSGRLLGRCSTGPVPRASVQRLSE